MRLVLAITYLWLLILLTGCSGKEGEIQAYAIRCTSKNANGDCIERWMAWGRDNYSVSTSRQEVIYWSQNGFLNRLDRCVVRNVRHWACQYPDDSGTVEMRDGILRIIPSRLVPESARSFFDESVYVSRWRYWWVWLKGWF